MCEVINLFAVASVHTLIYSSHLGGMIRCKNLHKPRVITCMWIINCPQYSFFARVGVSVMIGSSDDVE
jgi:hypothetical protein